MEFVIDVLGFKKPYDEIILKEVAIVAIQEDTAPTVFMFKSPIDWNYLPPQYKSENLWLKMNYHGIPWHSGEIPYEDMEETVALHLKDASKIYVKGLEKMKWLKKILTNMCNIEDLGCPSLKKLPYSMQPPCCIHATNYCKKPECAARNVIALKDWLIDYYNSPVFSVYKDISTKDAEEENQNNYTTTFTTTEKYNNIRDFYKNFDLM